MRSTFLSTTCAGLLMTALPTMAQTVNYGDLEDIFGQPVTTSATGKPQKVSEVPANMEIVTQDDIRRSGADNIPDVLQYLTGINFRRSSFNDGEVSIRGYDQPWNPRLLVLINGQPVYEDFFGDVVWPSIPVQLEEIRQIEVVKGPNAALFGFNAASGVINIVTYDPLFDSVNAATARTGTQALRQGSAVATAAVPDQYGLRVSAGGLEAHEFPARGITSDTKALLFTPGDETANFDGRIRLSDDVVLAMNGNTGAMKRNFPADVQFESDRTWSLRTRLAANTAVGLADLDVYWTQWKFDFPILQQADSTTRDVRMSDLFKPSADHTIRLSGEYKYNEASGQFFAGSKEYYDIYSAGLMWDWQIAPSLSLTNAVRQDHLTLGMTGTLLPQSSLQPADYNNRSIDATSFNSGLVFHATESDVIRLLVSRGYQLPSLNVLGMQLPQAGDAIFSGDPAARATSVTNYEVDYDRSVRPLNAVLRTALFHQNNDDLFAFLVLVPRGNLNSLTSTNIGNSSENGVEISLKSQAKTGWRWNIGYSYATIADHVGANAGTVLAEPFSVFKDATPHHTINAGIGYSQGAWEWDLRGGWRSRSQDWQFSTVDYLYYPVTTWPYATVDLHVGYALTEHLNVGLTVDQLTQAYTYERGAGDPIARRVFGTVTARF